jgi:arylsulfatase A-like enzyme
MKARRAWPLLAFALAFCAIGAAPPPLRPRRTIVLAVFDTTRRDEVGAFGGDPRVTPTIDRLAREGLRYTNAFAPDSFTVPSHGAIFEGRLIGTEYPLPASEPTLAEKLRRIDFRTLGVSANWLLGKDDGFDRGFDFFTNVVDPTTRRELEQGRVPKMEARRQNATGFAVVDTLRGEMASHVRAADSVFIFLNFLDPHDPYTPQEPFRRTFAAGVKVGGHLRDENGSLLSFYRNARRLLPPDREGLRRLYRGEVAQADAALGEVRDFLRGLGRENETLWVVTADHGELFGEHGGWTHDVGLYEEEVHVPLVVRGPGIRPGGVDVAPIGLADLHRAVLEWAESGRWQPERPPPLFFHHVYRNDRATSDPRIATDAVGIAVDGWRIFRSDKGCRLFRETAGYWAEAPCAPEGHREAGLIARLNEEVRRRIGGTRLSAWMSGNPPAEWLRKLKALGYLDP